MNVFYTNKEKNDCTQHIVLVSFLHEMNLLWRKYTSSSIEHVFLVFFMEHIAFLLVLFLQEMNAFWRKYRACSMGNSISPFLSCVVVVECVSVCTNKAHTHCGGGVQGS